MFAGSCKTSDERGGVLKCDYLIKGRDPASILIEEMEQLTDTQIERINAVIKQCIEMCKEQNEQ